MAQLNTQPSPALVAHLRRASRDLVRELGFMQRTLAGTSLPPSGVHALIEVGRAGSLQAGALAALLRLDKSTVSRLTATLERRGLVAVEPMPADGRGRRLTLTATGVATLAEVERFADDVVVRALGPLDQPSRETILTGVAGYANALGAARDVNLPGPTIVDGYVPGIAGRIVELHARYYARAAGFGAAFEAVVAKALAEFLPRLDHSRNGLWHARQGERIVGSIAIDGEDLGEGVAHLRWFIVEDGHQGQGLGRALLDRALAFVDACDVQETRLWTFEGLDAARRLYEANGFTLAETWPGDQWGKRVNEQRFVRQAPVR